MTTQTRLRAWDFIQADMAHVTGTGGQREMSAHQKALCATLDELCGTDLPVAVIYNIGSLVCAAFAVGKAEAKDQYIK